MKISLLNFSYKNNPVFKDFHFETDERAFIIKGYSGCGKTTLLKLISGNLQSNTKFHFDEYLSTLLIIQEDALIPWLTGKENITKFLNIEDAKIMRHPLFSIVRPFIDKRGHQMSFGQRRMVELFRAILYQPNLLLLDEPFNFLDVNGRREFSKALLSLATSKTQIVITSHYQEDTSDMPLKVYSFPEHSPTSTLIKLHDF